MKKDTVNALHTSFLNATNDSDKMCKCLGSFFHNDEYLTVEKLALTDFFGTKRVLMESIFRREYGSRFLTRGADTQLSPVAVLLRIARFVLGLRSLKGSNFSDSQGSM